MSREAGRVLPWARSVGPIFFRAVKKYMLACCTASIMQQRVGLAVPCRLAAYLGKTEAVRDLISGVTHPGPKGDKFKMAARLRRLLDPEET